MFQQQLATAGQQWKPLDAPVRGPIPRHVQTAAAVLSQFQVESSARYQPVKNTTFCNIFAWDFTRAMGCELPHWIDVDCEPCTPGIPGALETTANQLYDLLLAGRWWWREIEEAAAAARAAAGFPTVGVWYNSAGPGHIAVVEPLPASPGLRVAQAGAVCGRQFALRSVFGGGKVVRFFTHD